MSAWFERGGPVMWPLLFLSLTAMALIVERLLFWLRERRNPAREAVERVLKAHPEGGTRPTSSIPCGPRSAGWAGAWPCSTP